MTIPTLIVLNPDKYNQGPRYYLFMFILDRCKEICNTLDDLFNRICVTNKTEDVDFCVFNMITRTNETKTLAKLLS